MPKYLIAVREVHVMTKIVEANSPEEAQEEARYAEIDNLEYSHTLEDTLTVTEVQSG